MIKVVSNCEANMPLPPALAARLAKRGLIPKQDKNGKFLLTLKKTVKINVFNHLQWSWINNQVWL